ncbi:hypothetical protein MN608_11610 [Microdochium nivale]|nr:hypothetical protein MN608_11610 [Microdochium nivale]
MAEFFGTVSHVNAIIFTCRANEARTTFLAPVATYVFHLFAKDVRSCLRTIYTFSDAGLPLARGALKALGWPVENGEISVNNSAFGMELDGSEHDPVVREGWFNSVRGQHRVLQMLLSAPPIPTQNSAEVVKDRISLEAKCALVERKILRTANEAQQLIADLGALARAVGAAPGDKIETIQDKAEERDLPPGKATTLCLDCNFTCHEICNFSEDTDKINCCAMRDGRCICCKGKCDWTRHRNARFTIVVVKTSLWIVPEEMITHWNTNNNSLEASLLTAMDMYMALQKELRDAIIELAELSNKLINSALRHDSSGLVNYIDTLILTARTQGAPPAQLIQLITARNTLVLIHTIKGKGRGATRDSIVLLEIIGSVRNEMQRRSRMKARERAEEEEKSCTMYNVMREELPNEIQHRAPSKLPTDGIFSKGARYNENLQAVVKLVKVILEHGGVVAALVGSKASARA